MTYHEPTVGYPEQDLGLTHGHSGSDTSRERAIIEAKDGTASQREARVLGLARETQRYGITVQELRDTFGWHHGQASSVLSVLHKDGRLARLAVTRNRCKVYVLPEFVRERDTEPHGRNRKAETLDPKVEDALDRVESLIRLRGNVSWALFPMEQVKVLCEEVRRRG